MSKFQAGDWVYAADEILHSDWCNWSYSDKRKLSEKAGKRLKVQYIMAPCPDRAGITRQYYAVSDLYIDERDLLSLGEHRALKKDLAGSVAKLL